MRMQYFCGFFDRFSVWVAPGPALVDRRFSMVRFTITKAVRAATKTA
jgi:hypothetical protein